MLVGPFSQKIREPVAIDKTKVAQNAQKYIQKGQFDKAIKEYQLLVEADPKDIRSLLKIAELHGKLNQKDQAVAAFRKVADQYTKSGFYTKAVAVLRQAIDADPKQAELYQGLAELYQKLGLLKDALIQLGTLAKIYQDEGKHDRALAILDRMREIDPEDPSVLARYGEALFNAGQKEKAVGIFRSLVATLKTANKNDELVRFCERILTINPDDLDALRDLSHAYVKMGLANKALLKLKALFDRGVMDAELYDLLDRSYSLLGKEDKAIHAQVEKAKHLLAIGKAAEAKRTYELVLERDPNNAEALAYLRPSRSGVRATTTSAAAPSSATAAARPAPTMPGPVRAVPAMSAGSQSSQTRDTGPSKQLSKFLTEADVYLKYGLREKAIEQLENVLQHDPGNVTARHKLVDIYTADQPAKAAAHLRALAEISESLGEVKQAQDYLQRANALAASTNSIAVPVGEAVSPAPEEDVLLGGDEEAVVADNESGILDDGEISIETTPQEDEAAVTVEIDGETEPAETAPDMAAHEELGGFELGDEDEPAEAGIIDFDLGGPSLDEELDEAEFYIQQGIYAEAKEIYERILARKPGHAKATERLAWVMEQIQRTASASKRGAIQAAQPQPQSESAKPTEPESMFDLAAELEEELDFGADATAGPAEEEPPSFDDIFAQFKKGVERELKNDASAHYDLGIAYKEMGLVADAIGEFEIALGDPAREVEACNMIAICHQQLGHTEKAVEYYQRALASPRCTPEAALNMNYELACLYENVGDIRNAALYFKKVIEQDKTYRDVGERIRALKAKVQSGKAYA